MTRTLYALVGGLALFLAIGAEAHDYRHGDLVIGHPWARATPGAARVGAGYLTIANDGEAADRLVAARVPFAGRVELHEMTMVDDVMRMRELADGIELPPGATVALEPGGLHMMFIQLREPLVEGDRHVATLVFERAGPVEVEFHVESLAGGIPHHHAH